MSILYLLSPFYTLGERQFNRRLACSLAAHSFGVILPQDYFSEILRTDGKFDNAAFKRMADTTAASLDLLVVMLDDPNIESRALEMRLPKGKPTIGVHTHFYIGDFGKRPSARIEALANGFDRKVLYSGEDFDELAKLIAEQVRELLPS